MILQSWSAFKTLVGAKKLLMQYVEESGSYVIRAPEASTLLWAYQMPSTDTADVSDFETNFKPTANAPIEIKAGVGRSQRICVSPQPLNTYWYSKGYVIDCGANDTSKELIVTFPAKVFLLGGSLKSADVTAGDKFRAEVQMEISGTWTTILTPIDDVYILPNETEAVKSTECMELATVQRIRLLFTPATTGVAKKLYANLEFFK